MTTNLRTSAMPDLTVARPEHPTAKACAVRLTQTAHRAADDPRELSRAVRIVRAALATHKVDTADLTPLPLDGDQ